MLLPNCFLSWPGNRPITRKKPSRTGCRCHSPAVRVWTTSNVCEAVVELLVSSCHKQNLQNLVSTILSARRMMEGLLFYAIHGIDIDWLINVCWNQLLLACNLLSPWAYLWVCNYVTDTCRTAAAINVVIGCGMRNLVLFDRVAVCNTNSILWIICEACDFSIASVWNNIRVSVPKSFKMDAIPPCFYVLWLLQHASIARVCDMLFFQVLSYSRPWATCPTSWVCRSRKWPLKAPNSFL